MWYSDCCNSPGGNLLFIKRETGIQDLKKEGSKLSYMKTPMEIPEANPELRSAKIASLKKALREGSYKIRSEGIAIKILKEIIFEHHMEIHY